MSVHENGLKYTQLPLYAPEMVKDMRNTMSLFVAGLGCASSKECRVAMLIDDMDREEYRNKKAKTGNESG